MKRLMILCVVLTAIALAAAPVFAEVQNVKLSGDVTVLGIYRDGFDLHDDAPTDQTAWYETITRVQVDADLTDNVSTCVRLLNERDWDVETSATTADTQVDLDLANITMKELFYAPLTVIVGRQELKYGTGLVIGDPDRNDASVDTDVTAVNYSARKAFDAIRGIIELDNVTIDLVTAKINEDVAQAAQDIDLYGVDIATTINDVNVAGYAVFVNDNWTSGTTTNEEILTIGARAAKSLSDDLDVSAEIAMQTGDYSAGRDQKALAADVAIDYALSMEMSPVLGLAYSYRSGDKAGAAATSDQEAWTPLYEDQTNGIVADFLFDGLNGGVNSNCHIINVSAAVEPVEDLMASINYYQYILAEKLDATTMGTLWSNTITNEDVNSDTDLGSEIDLALNYAYTEDVSFGITSAWFLPGDLFNSANNDRATEVVGSIDVAF